MGYLGGRMKLSRILETALYAPNLDEAGEFYARLLGHEPYQKEGQRHVFFKLDEAMLLLFNPETTSGDNQGIPSHGARGQGHVCFRIDEDRMEAWKGLGSQSSLSTSGPTARSPCIFETRPATASSWPRGEFGAMSESTARRCKGGALTAWHKRLDNFSAIYAAIIVCGRDPSPAHRRVPSRGFGRLTGAQRQRR